MIPFAQRLGLQSGGGSSPYVAKAVHFDGSAWLKAIGALTGVVDSPLGIMSVWVKAADWFNNDNGADGMFFLGPDFNVTCNNGEDISNLPKFTFYNIANDKYYIAVPGITSWTPNLWINVLAAWDMGHPAGQRVLQLYYSDVSVIITQPDESGSAFSINYAGTGWQAGGATDNDPDGPGPIGDLADFWFAPGQFIDLTVESNRRKFIDAEGKPVDLGSAGSTPTGTAPAIFFSGDHSTFALNQGTGGAFTLTGSLTNASTSPSD